MYGASTRVSSQFDRPPHAWTALKDSGCRLSSILCITKILQNLVHTSSFDRITGLSVCPSTGPQQQTNYCRLAALVPE